MIIRYSNMLQRISRGWVVILFLLLFILTVSVVFPLFARLLNVPEEGVVSIDTQFFYTADRLYEMMGAYGEQGRQGYAISHISADLIFPLVYAFLFATSISFTFVRAFSGESWVQRLNLTPFALLGLDLLENITLIVLLLAYPASLTPLAYAASVITLLKWVAVAVVSALPLLGLIRWLWLLVMKAIGSKGTDNTAD